MNEGMVINAATTDSFGPPKLSPLERLELSLKDHVENLCERFRWEELSIDEVVSKVQKHYPDTLKSLYKEDRTEFEFDDYIKLAVGAALERARDDAADMLVAAINECRDTYVHPDHQEFFYILDRLNKSTNGLYRGFNKIRNKPTNKPTVEKQQ